MSSDTSPKLRKRPLLVIVVINLLVAVGAGTFAMQLVAGDADKAWQAYLINLLLFSAIAHGALLFSTLMHVVHARWGGVLADLAEAFSAFFPISFILFILLFNGKSHVFPWMLADLHGKEGWLNIRFMLGRDVLGLLILYGLGFAYLYHALWFKIRQRGASGALAVLLRDHWKRYKPDEIRFRKRRTLFAYLYMLAFALVLSLLGYDLVMALDPHWYSTLFGAYSFVKSIYVGFGGLIMVAAILHLSGAGGVQVKSAQFHDIGKLFFAFCLVWADFFYAQFVVIWYGNIPEETAYIIERTMTAPWNTLAWTVFAVCFIAPFLILLNKKIKTIPAAMIVICGAVLVGMWLEHFLLVGPAFYQHVKSLPLSWTHGTVALGFLGLLAGALLYYLEQFPEILQARSQEVA
jgi:TRAP-type C4-dicarboxylate transport system permease small subunit